MSTIESRLTRKLNLRFIDARKIASEARVSLGIDGYPSEEQLPALNAEAERIFYAKSSRRQSRLQQKNTDFEAMKSTANAEWELSENNSSHSMTEARPSPIRAANILLR